MKHAKLIGVQCVCGTSVFRDVFWRYLNSKWLLSVWQEEKKYITLISVSRYVKKYKLMEVEFAKKSEFKIYSFFWCVNDVSSAIFVFKKEANRHSVPFFQQMFGDFPKIPPMEKLNRFLNFHSFILLVREAQNYQKKLCLKMFFMKVKVEIVELTLKMNIFSII